MKKRHQTLFGHAGPAALLCSALLATACGDGAAPGGGSAGQTGLPPSSTATSTPLPALSDESALQDAVFRIHLESVEATFDLFPGERRLRAQAQLVFRMRPGQRRPVVHFDPTSSAADVSLVLDGAALRPRESSDVRLISYDGSGQVSLELERDLGDGPHRLEASYSLPMADANGRFFTDVNDLAGRGNEALFPTLNTPQELALHRLVFRVHAGEPYLAVGSGLLTAEGAGGLEQWTLDTERPVASYTVMFHLAPARTHVLSESLVAGVPVRVLAPTGGTTGAQAFDTLEPWLGELQRTLGPFPMPRGLSIVLTQGGGGMEYYGATTTSLAALRHEVFHMYFGTSTVARTYRDSWWDEAIDMWYELSSQPGYPAIPDSYRSDIVNGRSAVAVGFDRRAYDQGAQVFQAVADGIGGREPMVALLRDLHERRSFDPFTTWDLVDEIRAASGVDFRERFRLWLYQGPYAAARAELPSAWDWLHEVDTRMPQELRPACQP